ncbi:alpha-mannosidase [Paenibacillus sp. y28]|uniref:alpha-mannosidase n=1 Tax=Paenibacillus sp. y28 TaxID=3129110 RepID=UPI00301778B7
MFWTIEKLTQRLKELSPYRYRDAIGLNDWSFRIDEEKQNGARPPAEGSWSTITKGERWKGRDLYVWLRRQVHIPDAWSGRTVVGLFDFGKTGDYHNSGFESLLYVNGSPYQGVDSNHHEVFLPKDAAGETADLCFRLWSGLEGGGVPADQEHQFKQADLAWLDEAADDLYYTGRAMLDTAKTLGENDPQRHGLLQAVDRAFLLLDWSKPGSEQFYTSVTAAGSSLREALSAWEKKHGVTVHCIGHTHIDVAWLWRLTHTREKAARSFSTVLRLMEKYPEYVFLQTQPQLYAYIKNDYPDIYEQIKARVKEGRWEAGGAMWLEADCNLPSGEALVRQILYGTRFLREEFGAECSYLWLPDVFGYSWALPQILKKSGIDTFMTTKIGWNQYNRLPHDTFRWRGIDGSEVLTYVVTTPPSAEHTGWSYTYNGFIEPYSVQGIWNKYRDKELNQDLLLAYGYGDGGGGVNRDMLEMRRRLEVMPGLPHVVPSRADDFFQKLQHTVQATDQYVHTWDGELYLEYHRGTYTSQAYNKRMNRKLELLYRESEWIQVLNSIAGQSWSSYPASKLNQGWEIVLRNQFHDIIPGSSITEVYEDSRLEYEEADRLGREVWQTAAQQLTAAGDEAALEGKSGCSWTVFNSASFDRSELVYIPAPQDSCEGSWKDGEGRLLKADRVEGSWQVMMEEVPALGCTTITWSAEPAEATDTSPFTYTGHSLTTPFYILAWNEAGQLTRIYDREAKREVLAAGQLGNVLQIFEDKPVNYEAWDIDIFYGEKQRSFQQLEALELLECGQHRAVVGFKWAYMDSAISQRLIVYAHSRRIDFDTEADWHEQRQLLKAAFPVSVRSTEATFDIQFGNVKRPTHWNTSWDYARFETVGHQWADLSERGYGVSLLNDCKYGYDVKDNVLRLTLIKSALHPDPHADQGRHVFTYSLLPHQGDWVAGQTAQEAWALNNPLTCHPGAAAVSCQSLFRCSADYVTVDAVKKAEDSDCLIVRLHEFTGARGSVRLTSAFSLVSWQETDLMERPIGKRHEQSAAEFDIEPYEIKTFLIELKRG